MLVSFVAMIGKIYINGQIGSFDEVRGVELIDVIKQVQGQPFAESFDVYINSVGGIVEVGFDIYDYLKSLKVPVSTIGVGCVASIATVIFMAGENRRLRANTEFMIHLPSGEAKGTAEQIDSYSKGLREVETTLIKFYKEVTGLSEEALKPLLRNETFLSNADAFDLKFSTEQEIDFPMVAKLYINSNIDTKMTQEDKSWIESQFENFKALFSAKPKAIKLLDSVGTELEFTNVEDGQMPQIGSEAMVDGKPAEGDFIMPQLDNAIVTFVGGVVTEIKPAEGGGSDDEEMANLTAENERLKQELADATAVKDDATSKLETIEAEFTAFKANVTARFGTTPTPQPTPAPILNVANERLNKLKNKK